MVYLIYHLVNDRPKLFTFLDLLAQSQHNKNNSPRTSGLSFVLLCTAQTDRVQKQMRKLAWNNFTSS